MLFRREKDFLKKYPELAEKMKEEQEAKKKEKEKTKARGESMRELSESSNAKPDAFVPEKP